MASELQSLWLRLRNWFAVSPRPISPAEANFLLWLQRNGGMISDAEEGLDAWSDEMGAMVRQKLISMGSGWNCTISITDAGEAALVGGLQVAPTADLFSEAFKAPGAR